MLLVGCDFSSSPSRRKPIVLALGALQGGSVVLQDLQPLDTLAAFGRWLAAPRCRAGGVPLAARSVGEGGHDKVAHGVGGTLTQPSIRVRALQAKPLPPPVPSR